MTTAAWEYEKASDRLLGEEPGAFSDHVSVLTQVPAGAVFLRNNQQRLEIWWHGQLAVVGHSDSDENDLECAITEASLEKGEPATSADLIDWTCSCCGVGLGRFRSSMHIRRDAALEIFKHVLLQNRRPDRGIDGPIIWITVEAD